MVSTRVIRTALVGLIGVVALILTACQPVGTPKQRTDAGGRPCTVSIVGDSLALGIERFGDPIGKFAERGCTVVAIDTKGGRTVSEGADIVETWARNQTLGEILVVVLGTNNCTYEAMDDGVRRILAAAGPDRPIVWQTTYRPGCDTPVNAALRDHQNVELARPEGGRLWLVDHHANVTARPELVSDGMHMGPEGYRASTLQIANTVSTVIIK